MLRVWLQKGRCFAHTISNFSTSSWKSKIVIHKEVSEALLNNKPVIALESTIITHGMPFPQNLKTARSVIEIIRRNGVVPATVAVLNGKLHIGLTRSELEYVAKMGKSAIKTSRRDLSVVLSKGLVGGTTVSGTMVAAAKAGIPVFVTGGIGGVHYGADKTFDISADLVELGQTPVAVVCAGVKSILDIGLTLEYLETQGVTVATYGDSLDFPAFFTPHSGFKVPYNVRTPQEAAMMIVTYDSIKADYTPKNATDLLQPVEATDCNLELELSSGMVIAVPIPESHALLGTQIETAIQQALQNSKKQGVSGKDVTPFILQQVNKFTKGKSLEANIALIQNNALVGSQIALELTKLRKIKVYGKPKTMQDVDECSPPKTDKQPVIVGGSNVDFTAKANSDIIYNGATNVGNIRQTFGGVGRNIAECLARVSPTKPLFISAVGADDLGEMLLRQLEFVRVSTYGVHVCKDRSTATYSVVLNSHGDVVVGIGDMEAHNEITTQLISAFEEPIRSSPMVIIDGNIDEEVIHYVIQLCKEHKTPVVFEPTCITKAAKPFTRTSWKNIAFTTPNLNELRTMNKLVRNEETNSNEQDTDDTATSSDDEDAKAAMDEPLEDILKECIELCTPLMQNISTIIVTLGQHGVLVCRDVSFDTPFLVNGKLIGTEKENKYGGLVSATHYPALGEEQGKVDVVSFTGAGDSLIAAFLSSVIAGHDPDTCVKAGLMGAWYSLQTSSAVAASITPEHFTVENVQNWAPWQPRELDIEGPR